VYKGDNSSHELLILNVLPFFPESHFFICWPYSRGADVVDYVLTNQTLLPFIHHFSMTPLTLADHALLSFSLQVDTPPPLMAHLRSPFSLRRVIPTSLHPISAKGSHPSPYSPTLLLLMPNTHVFHPPFGKMLFGPTPITPSPPHLPWKLDLVP
jgi:hypothetical protein